MQEATAADFGMNTAGKVKGKPMSPGFALFNQHVNKAGERAFALLDRHFPKWANEVRAAEQEGGGIMALLQTGPTPASAAYIALVTAFVNEDRLPMPRRTAIIAALEWAFSRTGRAGLRN